MLPLMGLTSLEMLFEEILIVSPIPSFHEEFTTRLAVTICLLSHGSSLRQNCGKYKCISQSSHLARCFAHTNVFVGALPTTMATCQQ